MTPNLGTASLCDEPFLQAFEDCQLDPGKLRHADHMRIAWLCVKPYGAAHAEEKLWHGIHQFAECAGVPQKIHAHDHDRLDQARRRRPSQQLPRRQLFKTD